MTLKFFDEQSKSSDDLPWINDFIDENPEIEDDYCSPIQGFVRSNKGWIVLCKDYKGFLFKDSSICKFLEEAIDYWKHDPKNASNLPGLFLSCESKPRIAFDDTFKNVRALFEGKNKVLIIWDSGNKDTKKPKKPTVNPFLPPTQST